MRMDTFHGACSSDDNGVIDSIYFLFIINFTDPLFAVRVYFIIILYYVKASTDKPNCLHVKL